MPTTLGRSKLETDHQFESRNENFIATGKYKVYTALISKTGVGQTPTVIVLENTIGNIVWSDGGTGITLGTLENAFISEKTFVSWPIHVQNGKWGFITRFSESQIKIVTYSGSDTVSTTVDTNILANTPIEIRIYN